MNIYTIKYSFGEERLRQGTARALPPGEAFARALPGRRGRYRLVCRREGLLSPSHSEGQHVSAASIQKTLLVI